MGNDCTELICRSVAPPQDIHSSSINNMEPMNPLRGDCGLIENVFNYIMTWWSTIITLLTKDFRKTMIITLPINDLIKLFHCEIITAITVLML